jgi:hypothetical protein
MPAIFHNDIYDSGISQLTTIVENLVICSAQPTTYAEAQTYKLGTKAAPSITGPTDKSGGGREISIAAITNGTVTVNGTATHFALLDDSASKMLVSQALDTSQVVTAGNPFTTTLHKVGIPAPTA